VGRLISGSNFSQLPLDRGAGERSCSWVAGGCLSPPLRARGVLVLSCLALALILLVVPGVSNDASAFRLPDTGQTKCYQEVSPYAEILPCPVPGTPLAQDGSYGINPKNYTVTGLNIDMVQDNNTGLVWQRQDDGNIYNWYEATGTVDPLYNPSGASFKNVCGSLSLGGYSNWRLPTKKELITIVDYSVPWNPAGPLPTIDTVFTGTASSYWTSTSYVTDPLRAWGIGFGNGANFYGGDVFGSNFKDDPSYVRCVRGDAVTPVYMVNGPAVTDIRTGLIWQKEDDGVMRTWGEALSYCESLALAGQSGWRLPNIIELESITDDSRNNPAIGPVFTNTKAAYYWSSTTYTDNAYYGWDVGFYDGNVYGYGKDGADDYVRCVQTGAVVNITSPDGTVTSSPAGINCGTTCSAPFLKNSFVAFEVIPGADKAFSGLSCLPDFNPDGSISGDMNCNAVYGACGATQIARIGTSAPDTVMNTYAGASPAIGARDTVEVIGTNQSIIDLDFNLPLNISLIGGYDCLFTTPASYTVFSGGKVTISKGSVVIDRIIIM